MKRAAAMLLILGLGTVKASACAACYGAPGDVVTQAIGNSILFMIGVISLVLCSIVGLFATFFIRASRNPLPDESAGNLS